MSKFLKIFKKWQVLLLNGLLALIFANKTKAQEPIIIANPLYGIRTPEEMLVGFLPWIVGIFLIFVAAPIAGLIWYRKRGGKKKWPTIVIRILVSFFVLVLAAYIILLLVLFLFS